MEISFYSERPNNRLKLTAALQKYLCPRSLA